MGMTEGSGVGRDGDQPALCLAARGLPWSHTYMTSELDETRTGVSQACSASQATSGRDWQLHPHS